MTDLKVGRIAQLTNVATPGPWKAVKNPMRDDGYFVVRDVPPVPYAVTTDAEPLPPAVIHSQVQEADAKLIAAAPDLLKELRSLVKEIKTFHPTFDAHKFVAAERVIAKAEGR